VRLSVRAEAVVVNQALWPKLGRMGTIAREVRSPTSVRSILRMVASRTMALLGTVLMLAPGWPAHALQASSAPPPGVASEAPALAPQQLEDLVAPIALYPDPFVAQILAAATYPLEVVEADRWVHANPSLKGTALTDAAGAGVRLVRLEQERDPRLCAADPE
jgi:hypothetical protein